MLSIVVPCFNEQESLPYFVKEVENVGKSISHSIEYIFVNDGSKDETLKNLRELHQKMPDRVRYISFSKNFGKESALY
ncbi:MAG: glycosyltransferase, partial [Tetragenococcus koreensis]|nr:glycosyltransferase [Tetragenococcus koreensis]MDN6672156.1 glycosyltransferase [Staphylococcus equorum]